MLMENSDDRWTCVTPSPRCRGGRHMVDVPLHRCRGLRGRRILVSEDEALISMLLVDEITAAGATVVGPAHTLDGTLVVIEEAQCNGGLSAALLDIRLFAKSVLPAADRLAELGVPFLFATASDEPSARPGHLGVPVIRKPYS